LARKHFQRPERIPHRLANDAMHNFHSPQNCFQNGSRAAREFKPFNRSLTELCLPVRREFPIMADPKYGRNNIVTIIRRHGTNMNRILRIIFLCLAAHAGGLGKNEGDEYGRIGFNPMPFVIQRLPEVQHAMNVLLAEVTRCKEICDSHGMTFHLVTVPGVSENVLRHPARARLDAAHRRLRLPGAGTGDCGVCANEWNFHPPARPIRPGQKMDAKKIRSLYLSNGTGHLTEKGHWFFTGAIWETFYKK
jgi:hypothetical protein